MQFEKQQYQIDCVNNIIQVLKECNVQNNDYSKLNHAVQDIWKNKQYHQFKTSATNRLDILMETGTGKTFTYLKTILEIHKQFRNNKFIIVVPRTAIKLGIIQNIKLTDSYFYNEYKQHLKYIDYPKDGLEKIKGDFLNNEDLCILITTNSAFNADKNRINRRTENLFEHGSTWEAIKDKKPIVIIDEPHLLKGHETQKGLDKLDDALHIRFGATFPQDKKDEKHHLSNVVYALDSISAFNQYLVKRIRVNTIYGSDEGNIKVTAIQVKQKTFTIVFNANGVPHTKQINITEDIGTKTDLPEYQGVSATKITSKTIYLSNEKTLDISLNYTLGDEDIRIMVRKTIETHFEKEKTLFEKGIKTLSLFFIPNINDFRETESNANPRIKHIFEQEYEKARKDILEQNINEKYRAYLNKDFSEDRKLQVHEGYFSGDKVRNKDKQSGFNKDDIGINTILNEKEKLLSFDTPLRFIFSVWALQEGWDNPNIFTICKLASTSKDTSRRQQVGRGLRIATNQEGKRLTHTYLKKEEEFYAINTLDIIVSGKEQEFIQNIQKEIQDASFSLIGDTISLEFLKEKGLNDDDASTLFITLKTNNIINKKGIIQSSIYEFLKGDQKIDTSTPERYKEILNIFQENSNPVINGNTKPKTVKIRRDNWTTFKTLWETINKTSRITYTNIDEDSIIEKVAKVFNAESIPPIKVRTVTEVYNAKKDKIETKQENTDEKPIEFFSTQSFMGFINDFVKEEKLPMSFMLKLLNALDKKKIKNNPNISKEKLRTILKDTIHGTIISNVSYAFLDTNIYPNSLQDENGEVKENIPHTALGKYLLENNKPPEHLLYDSICYDSNIEKTIQEEDPENIDNNKITVFAKLPKIDIPTPYKTYNPDFAYSIKQNNKNTLFLVVEAKGYKNENDIPEQEKYKIGYAKKFFESLKKELKEKNIDIQYQTRLTSESLSTVLTKTNKQKTVN